MNKRVLVAYATKCGSTAEVADVIGHVLREAGEAVDVRNVEDIQDLKPYGAVVLGSAIRMGKPLPAASRFVRQHRAALAEMPVALFSVGTTMNEDTPEHRATAQECLASLTKAVQPVSVGLFGGKVDLAALSPFWRFATSFIKEEDLDSGDHRNWQAIRLWANTLIPLLNKVSQPTGD
ncbi:MAG: flavodoxin [Chloroflexi bacterium]|jgi:menaquinone-dependent protoporphyrinogen oxidase|nr:flavodoxin [Chloroflexota bacterium]